VYEQIGLGGMATVHRAEQQGFGGFSKQIALKRMLPSVAADATLVKSFIREARLASHLRHANVAQTYDLGKVGNTYFIAMELVPGRNLREILRHCAQISGTMPLPIAMNIVNQICDALDYAHNLCDESGQPLGIIHRDVSPSNVIVSEGGVVKLIDFGIAKATGSGMTTKSGMIKGKFSYMAPESLVGNVDARADLFALGVIAYELLTSQPLFQGKDDMDTLLRVRQMTIDPPSRCNTKVPTEIDTIVMTALERDPDQRWQRATALRTALTTETKRLGLIAHNTEVIDWIEWAFRQAERHGDEESAMISIERMQTGQSQITATDTIETLAAPSGSQPLPKQRSREIEVPTLPDPDHNWKVLTAPTLIDRPNGQIPQGDWSDDDDVETRQVRTRRSSAPELPQRPSQPQLRGSGPAITIVGAAPSGLRAAPPPTAPPPIQPSQPAVASLLPAPAHMPFPPAHVPLPPAQLPPLGAAMSGARTAPHLPRSELIEVSTSAILDERSAMPAPPTSVQTRVDQSPARASNFLLAVLVLIAAGAAAAVVYFALPYFT
jgi:serine/threonine protein kinase